VGQTSDFVSESRATNTHAGRATGFTHWAGMASCETLPRLEHWIPEEEVTLPSSRRDTPTPQDRPWQVANVDEVARGRDNPTARRDNFWGGVAQLKSKGASSRRIDAESRSL
jgi:hypothetical protein